MYLDFNIRQTTKNTKLSNYDWQIVDDDISINHHDDNQRIKSIIPSTSINTNANNQNQTSSFYLNHYEQQRKKENNYNEDLSNYFPLPQTNIKKPSSSIQINETKNPIQQWKTVPAPPVISARSISDSSIELPNSTRIISVVPLQLSDDNQYSSTTGTESLGTKITKLATDNRSNKKFNHQNDSIGNFNFNQQYNTVTTTTDTEQGLYSDRQATYRDQTGFFSNRDDPLNSSKYQCELVERR